MRIKTDCQQFDMKEDTNEENEVNDKDADNIELEPVVSPSVGNNSPHEAPQQRAHTGLESVSVQIRL